LYQFSKTLNQLLQEDDTTLITVEGIIEDIDVATPTGTKAIQCKYHESVEDFSLSNIYKPILQFLKHYSENKSNNNIKYILYAHFPKETPGIKKLKKSDIEEILNTDNKDYVAKYVSYIKPPKDLTIKALISKSRKTKEEKEQIFDYYKTETLDTTVDIDEFLDNKFLFEIGASYDELEKESKSLLEITPFSKKDIDDIFYPNAIQQIAELSILPSENERKVCKKDFVNALRERKTTAISRWTKELSNYNNLLKKRRKQLSDNLGENSRKRYFLINPENIESFDNDIINFLQGFAEKYVSKPKLHKEIPVFCFDKDKLYLNELVERIYSKQIEVETGFRGDKFFRDAFMRHSTRIENKNWFEFRLRLCIANDETIMTLNNHKADDLFLINQTPPDNMETRDMNIEGLDINNLGELEFLLELKKEL
jgi:hypothetical protein